MTTGWHRLIPPDDCFRGAGNYPLDAYSEFLPPPRVGWKPYGGRGPDPELFSPHDPFGWSVGEFEEKLQLRTGLEQVGKQVLTKLARLLDRDPHTGLPSLDLVDNPYWPDELAAEPALPHERCLTLLPLAFSRTQDDKGRVRWTLFGNSEQGPGKAFWKGFFTAPRKELPADEAVAFFSRLLKAVYGEEADGAAGLKRSGFRILPEDEPAFDFWQEERPAWTDEFLLPKRVVESDVRYLLTFRPFSHLPAAVRKAYLGGKLHLLPFPGSLTFWGVPGYRQLQRELPLALQIPLLLNVARHRVSEGVRVPQSGFLHEATSARPHAGHHAHHVRNTFKRTHRWDKVLRDQDELALIDREEKLLHVLFSTLPNDLNLYDKPMARNVQLWTEDHHLLLDGPVATPEQLHAAMRALEAGGLFGYRFHYPAMQVGRHEVYWHRTLIAFHNPAGEPVVLHDAPHNSPEHGYLTAYDTEHPNLAHPVELWPRFQQRPAALAALALHEPGRVTGPVIRGVRKLLDARGKCNERPLPRSVARALLAGGHHQTIESWFDGLPANLAPLAHELVEPEEKPLPRSARTRVPDSLTYQRTARRAFEVRYWNAIADLGEGAFVNKNNADCCRDPISQKYLPYFVRHLEPLGDHLLKHYARAVETAGMTGKALSGEMPFQWQTDFDYSWMGGWLRNQEGGAAERNIVLVIPGRDRSQAIIMSDHYDTAYMADRYQPRCGDTGARLAACGADDNHSATAAMMLAAPIFLDLSRKGQLERDIWLIHLTGEEFPADCLGARALSQRLVEGVFHLHLTGGKTRDLSKARVRGLYVSDMIAHNNDRDRDVFQISPGTDADSFRLAEHALHAAEVWNASVPVWNERPERAGRPPGRRSPHGSAVPEVAPHLALSAEIRTPVDPRSTLYNTDGQIFSDTGVPCVLFMENYDIDRSGYHDMNDTMANIDLDYGAALCAITIESVARAATVKE
jgi:hypothetical protein